MVYITNRVNKDYFVSGLALLISLFIYTVYRSEKVIINQLIQSNFDLVYDLIIILKDHKISLPEWMIYSLPEGLWIFAVTILSQNITLNFGKNKLNLNHIPIAYSIALELLQLLQITNGRFDWMDITVAFIFWFLAIFYLKNGIVTKKYSNIQVHKTLIITSYLILYLSDVVSLQ